MIMEKIKFVKNVFTRVMNVSNIIKVVKIVKEILYSIVQVMLINVQNAIARMIIDIYINFMYWIEQYLSHNPKFKEFVNAK